MNSKSASLITWFLILTLLLSFAYLVRDIIFPFAASFFIAYFLDPLVTRIARYKIGRIGATTVVVILMVCVFALGFFLIIPEVFLQIKSLKTQIPVLVQYFNEHLLVKATDLISNLDPSIAEELKKTSQNFSGTIVKYLLGFVKNLWDSGNSIINVLTYIFITPVLCFYMIKDWPSIRNVFYKSSPTQHKPTIRKLFEEIGKVLSGYFRGQVNVCMIMGLYYIIAFYCFGLNHALLLGMLNGALILIPYIGILFGSFFVFLTAYFQLGSIQALLPFLIIILIGQVLEGNFVTPRLIEKEIKLHPVWLFFAVFAGGSLFGFWGVFFSIPVAAIIGVFVRFIYNIYLNSKLYGNV